MNYISKTENRDLMAQAIESLKGLWGLAVGTLFVYNAIIIVGSNIPILGGIIVMLISGPMTVGLVIFSLSVSRGEQPKFSYLFDGFKKFGVSFGAYLLTTIFIFLWALLLIIPGIIAALSYSMTYYIIAENDSIGPLEAIRKSKEMMSGNKWKIFCLGCRFIGWSFLCLLTLGIGFLWLAPYMSVSYAKFYDDLKAEQNV